MDQSVSSEFPGGLPLVCNTDGGARGNPGPAATGIVLSWEGGVANHSSYLGTATNNVAEYSALRDALNIIADLPDATSYTFLLDSELVVRQVLGQYKVKEPTLQQYCTEIRSLLKYLPAAYSIRHVLRAENKAADRLVNETLDAQSAS